MLNTTSGQSDPAAERGRAKASFDLDRLSVLSGRKQHDQFSKIVSCDPLFRVVAARGNCVRHALSLGQTSSPGRNGPAELSTKEAGEIARRLFARENLVAWCIVPFDSKRRGPEDRAAMLERLGFKHFAYDWRAEHIPHSTPRSGRSGDMASRSMLSGSLPAS